MRLFFCLLACILPPPALAGEAKLDARIFAEKAEGEPASFLVVMREQADLSGAERFATKEERGRFVYDALRARAEATQAPLLERLRAAELPFRSFFLVNMIEVQGDRALAVELAGREDVFAVAGNHPAPLPPEPLGEPQDSFSSPPASRLTPHAAIEPNIEKIRAPQVWSRGFTGQGIVVAVADTGFLWDHPALRARYRGFDGSAVSHDYNWHDAIHAAGAGNPCGSNSAAPCDDHEHGTSVAGLIAGSDGAEQIGVAPDARLIGCRNMDRGVGTPATYTECFQFFLAPTDSGGQNPRPDLAPDIINNSWGCPPEEGCTDPDILRAVVENTRAAGILVVMAAGNRGGACSTVQDPPAIYEASFSVGATTLSDAIAGFSGRGPVSRDGSGRLKPDLVAPGVGVRTARSAGGYRTFSGTSAAAPHVSGAVALLYSAAPSLRGRAEETADILRRSAQPLFTSQNCSGIPGTAVPNAVFGWGRLDVAGAVNIAVPVARAAPTPGSRRGGVRALPPRS